MSDEMQSLPFVQLGGVEIVPELPRATTDWETVMYERLDRAADFYIDDKSQEDFPRLPGLRKLARLAGVTRSYPEHTPVVTAKSAVFICTYHLEFSDGTHWASSADSNPGNNGQEPFCNYPSTMAEARAESRAILKALGIAKHSAEEMALAERDRVPSAATKIDKQQIVAIEAQCNLKKVSVVDALKGGLSEAADSIASLEQLTSAQGMQVLKFLNSRKQKAPTGAAAKRDARKKELEGG